MLSPEERRVFVAAIEVAIAPHARSSRGMAFAALVPWSRIDALREALDAAGIDWCAVKREQDARDAQVLAREGHKRCE